MFQIMISMIENIIGDITTAKNNRAYLSALGLSLTLPSILSGIDHNRRSSGKDYSEWFDQWVFKYYKQPLSDNEVINRGIEATKFDGKNCYALRCALLHAGNADLKDSNKATIDTFVLCVSDTSPHQGDVYICDVSASGTSTVYVSLNVVGLIDALIAGARDYMTENEDKIRQHLQNKKRRNVFGSIEIEIL